jgi:hypothetical protein
MAEEGFAATSVQPMKAVAALLGRSPTKSLIALIVKKLLAFLSQLNLP